MSYAKNLSASSVQLIVSVLCGSCGGGFQAEVSCHCIIDSGKTVQEALQVIKARMDTDNPLSPNTEDAQVDKVVKSMQEHVI